MLSERLQQMQIKQTHLAGCKSLTTGVHIYILQLLSINSLQANISFTCEFWKKLSPFLSYHYFFQIVKLIHIYDSYNIGVVAAVLRGFGVIPDSTRGLFFDQFEEEL